MSQNRYDIRLNFIPVEFTCDTFKGGVLPYEDSDQIRRLREKHGGTHVFRREGNQIQCVPVEQTAEPLGKAEQFSTKKHFTLANRLVQEALIRLFLSKGYEFCSVYPTTRLVITKEDMMASIFKYLPGNPPLFLHPQYEIESRVIVPHNSAVKFGILLNFSSGLGFGATAADLVSRGVDISGRYIVAEREPDQAEFVVKPRHRYVLVGRVDSVEGTTARLSDSRDEQTADCTRCYLEPRSENIVHCLASLYPEGYEEILGAKREAIFRITGARHQVERLSRVVTWLKNSEPIQCSADLSFTLSDRPYAPAFGRDAGNFRVLQSPTCVLRPGGSITVNWPVDPHLEDKGPFDAESFPKKKPRIAVIFPRRFKGEVEVFMRQFRDGLLTNGGYSDRFVPYSQGFIRKYRLTGCDIELRPLDGDSDDAGAYRAKCLEVLAEDIPYDLAMIVISESFHLLRGEENPYLMAKSAFMSQGMPVQEIEIETIQEERSRVYILNNLSVACYAKLGGIPWVMSPAPGLAHELIFGIGSARRGVSRLSPSERLVGITTVFSGDGNYLLANVSREVPFEEYQASLLGVLRNSLDQIRKRYAWQPGDKVRMIFHQTFKRYRDAEAAAVKSFVSEVSEFDVEYAFVHISRSHSWRVFDLQSVGINHWDNRTKRVKGEYVPWRGCYVPVGHKAALLCVTGPYQLKTHLQGCPEPILISLHRESTFSSLDYVAEQIYKLTFMSWRSFFPASMPVTIFYSDLIARLLGQLGGVSKWNPDMLATRLRESRWFL